MTCSSLPPPAQRAMPGDAAAAGTTCGWRLSAGREGDDEREEGSDDGRSKHDDRVEMFEGAALG
eukprot:SAG22_NODE_8783_length_630_cov_0.928437_1_plen_63_part_10